MNTTNFIKEKERQATLVHVFMFLVFFAILFWLFQPSFYFSLPKVEEQETEDYSKMISNLTKVNPNNFNEFQLISEFNEAPGKNNPFSTVFAAPVISQEEDEQDE